MSNQDSSKPAPRCSSKVPPQAEDHSRDNLEVDKSQWTKRQYQDDAFAQAIEAFPQLWDVTNPQFKDLEVAKRSWKALAKKHKKIFNLDTVRPVADIEALWVRMQDQTASVWKDAYAKFKLTPEASGAQPQVVLDFCQAKCSFFHAMKFNLDAEKAITNLGDQTTWPRLILGRDGEKKIRFSDGAIVDIKAMPLPLTKQKVEQELKRFLATMDERVCNLQNRIQAMALQSEKDDLENLFNYVMNLDD